MPIAVGSVVCVHNDGANIDTWIGVVREHAPGSRLFPARFKVKQLGRRQITTFTFEQEELRETIATFEGPVCIECRRPP